MSFGLQKVYMYTLYLWLYIQNYIHILMHRSYIENILEHPKQLHIHLQVMFPWLKLLFHCPNTQSNALVKMFNNHVIKSWGCVDSNEC